mmetsp:Transcript_114880/g.199018  ORF Transcript_114880/g.199018 Transcript_114880/m.199018 type:complete len:479 (+) Transcript_114880:188-1624(+)
MVAVARGFCSTAVLLALSHTMLARRATASTCAIDCEAEAVPTVGHALLQLHSVREERVTANYSSSSSQQQQSRALEQGAFRKLASAFLPTTWSTLIVFAAVLALCLFVAVLKYRIDYYEESHIIDDSPWYMSEFLQLKVGLAALGMWIAVGLAVFTQIVHFNAKGLHGEDDRMLSLIEAAYLCAQILTTVGYGDYTPSRPEGQLFVACFILIGVVVVAVVVTEILKVAMRRGERAVAKAVGFKEADHLGRQDSTASITVFSVGQSEESHALSARFRYMKDRHENFMTFLFSVGPFAFALAAGTAFFTFYPGENKSVWEAFYMSCITLTSVGFGVFTPLTPGGELFASVWMLVGVGATANMIVSFGDWFFYSRRSRQAKYVGNELLAEMDADGDGSVDRCEYLRFELIRCGMCQKEDIDAILFRFKIMDPSNQGIRIEHLRDLHEEPAVTRRTSTRSGMATGVLSRIWRTEETPAADAG